MKSCMARQPAMCGTKNPEMKYSPLAAFSHRIELGQPLPFDVHHPDRTVLLARGQVIHTQEQLTVLQERGAVVNTGELNGRRPGARATTSNAAPVLWNVCMERVDRALRLAAPDDFLATLDDAIRPVLGLIERDPDLAIFQVLREGSAGQVHYGVAHSLHAAITSHLVATRLGWSADDTLCVFKAALTMNISMLDLQQRLATQMSPPTSSQREAIEAHPLRSVAMLENAGVTDGPWLDAVAQHHEMPDGTGYPRRLQRVCEFAELVRRADVYTARLSARASRGALSADDAVREMFKRDAGHPMAAALAKEFGVYPPGCYVALASGETGVVIKRGDNLAKPVVAVMVSARGEPITESVRRDSAQPEYAIVSVVGEKNVRVRVPKEALLAQASGA